MAVYTEISDEELHSFIARYTVGEVISCKGIAEGVQNSNFLLVTDSGPYILTLYEKGTSTPDLPFFLALLEHLASKGLACPLPVRARNGETLQSLSGRPAALVTFLKGMWPRRIVPAHCAGVGEALARLHQAGQDFPGSRPNNLSLAGWRSLYEATAAQANSVSPGLATLLAEELATLEGAWPTDLPRGIIHADLFPDNVFFSGDKLSGLIDFYFACTDFLAYDIAVCLNAWCFEPDRSFNTTKARLLLSNYQRIRPLNEAELAFLPLLARGASVRFLMTRLFDWLNHPPGALVTPKDPLEYLAKLRFHQNVHGLTDYCLDATFDAAL